MGKRRPQLDCRDVKRLLRLLGFAAHKSKGSHDQFVHELARSRFRKVTVDCPKAPFSHDLVHSMASQAGVSVDEFYDAADGNIPPGWPNK